MADDQKVNWPSEEIPAEHKLYMRVHRQFVFNGSFVVGVFRDQGGGMSTEWEKYSSPADVRARAKVPDENGVIEMRCGDVGSVPGLTVKHTPDLERRVRGHTDVLGDKRAPEVRVKLGRISRWVEGFSLA